MNQIIVNVFMLTILTGLFNALLIKTFTKWGFFDWYTMNGFSKKLSNCGFCWPFRFALIQSLFACWFYPWVLIVPFTSWAITHFIIENTNDY